MAAAKPDPAMMFSSCAKRVRRAFRLRRDWCRSWDQHFRRPQRMQGLALVAQFGDVDAELAVEPFGDDGAVAPLAGPWAFEAAQHRDAAAGDAQEVVDHLLRIQGGEDLRVIPPAVFVQRDVD